MEMRHVDQVLQSYRMRLYNTLSRQLEDVKPLPHHRPDSAAPDSKGKIGLYACGPTVYDYTHVGHLRKYTMDDVLVRALRHSGFDVEFVQNVTDVGHLSSDSDTGQDKLEVGAKKYGQTVWDVARKFEDFFFYSMDLMGNLRPDVSCRATDHIEAQLELVKTLEQKGFTYVIPDDGVYFDTSKLDDYGRLARLKLDQLQPGARVDQVEGKRQPSDFALWKFERPGENRAMVWPSPWTKRSFPGWHVECSAMSMKYLGEQFEIHTGGVDHIPVHHVNEIAQSEAATGKKPFVQIWVHHNFLQVKSEKMSKSLSNFLTIDDVVERGFAPQALRLLFLSSHYRSEMNFTWDALEASSRAWQRLVSSLTAMSAGEPGQEAAERGAEAQTLDDPKQNGQQLGDQAQLGGQAHRYRRQFWQLIEDDLKTPEAVAVMWELLKDEALPDEQKLALVFDFDQALGLQLRRAVDDSLAAGEPAGAQELSRAELSAEVVRLLDQRADARQRQDWSTADRLRDQLADQGYQVIDEPDGKQRVMGMIADKQSD